MHRQQSAPAGKEAMKRQQRQRIQQVELPFDGQRPGMQQPFLMGRRIEIAGLGQILQVRGKQHAFARMPPKHLIIAGDQQPPAHQQHRSHQHQQSREDAPGARQIEVGQVEALALQAAYDDTRHEETGDDEEYVDPGKSPGKTWNREVIEHHGKYRPGAQAIDICTEARLHPRG